MTYATPGRAYFDARSPLHPAAAVALGEALADGWADPSRLHSEGRRAALVEQQAREAIAAQLGCQPTELRVSTSHPATLRLAVSGMLTARRRAGDRVVHSAVERGSVIAAAAAASPVPVRVDEVGRVDLDDWRQALRSPAALAVLQHANNEVGTLQPVEDAYQAAASAQVPLLVDAGASSGHLALPTSWDLLAVDPTSFGAPSGVGVLAVRHRLRPLPPSLPGEDPWAPGGVHLPLLVATAAALQASAVDRDQVAATHRTWRDQITRCAHEAGLTVAAESAERLAHVITLLADDLDGEALLTELDRRGVAVGSGSACEPETTETSHVLAAMGCPTHGNLRVALSWATDADDVARLCGALPGAVDALRSGR